MAQYKQIIKKTAAVMAVGFVISPLAAFAKPVGYAAQNGGTTGGAGGKTVRATSGTQIHEALCGRSSESTPIIIEVEGTITHGGTKKVKGDSCNTKDGVIELKDVSNVTIIGVGKGATFDQVGIHLRNSQNIIIRNVTVQNVKKSGSPTSNGGDAIGMEKSVSNVWVDHVTLIASGGEKDGFDGLFDVKNDSKYITLSYSVLVGSDRGGLIGSSETDTNNGPLTYHHNIFKNLKSRVPLLRGAKAHIYNNLYTGIWASGINVRAGGEALVENNYFLDSKNVLGTFYTDTSGDWEVNDNIFDNVEWLDEGDNQPAGPNPKTTRSVAVSYAYDIDEASCIPELLNTLSGANKGLRTSDGSCEAGSSEPTPEPTPTPEPQPTPAPQPTPDADPTPAPTPDTSEVTLKGSVADSQIKLTWNNPGTDSSIQVYQDLDSNPSGRVRIASVAADATSYTVNGLENGKTYYFWVKYEQSDGTYANSSLFAGTPEASSSEDDSSDSGSANPDVVQLSGTAGNGEVKLTWTDPGTGSSFQVYKDEDSNPSGRIRVAKVSSDTREYTVTGLENGKTYYFWVKYEGSEGKNVNSTMYSGTPSSSSSGGSDDDVKEDSGSDDSSSDNDSSNDNNENSNNSGFQDVSSSAAGPTAAAAKKAGANREPMTNGLPSFVKSKVSGATTVSSLDELTTAIKNASAGDVIYIRKGTYKPSGSIEIKNSGSSSKAIVLSAYPGDTRPVFDFSKMSESSSNRAFIVNGSYWHIYGFDIKKSGDNGMYVKGSYNTIEFMKFYENADTGLQIDNGAAYNFVKNSDSYFNADSSLENADGFAAKLKVGTGNYFYGCRAWNNLDDGFDGYLRDNGYTVTTTWEYSWMIRNGFQKNGSEGVGDGNGFKTGGSDGKDLAHNGVYINTIAAGNTHDGYDQNSNRGEVTIYNSIAYKNARNYGLSDGSERALKKLTVKNSISLDTDSSDKFGAKSTQISNNSWNGNSASSDDFMSMDIDQLLAERKKDGSLPDVKFFCLENDSSLIDAGTDVGLDYNGSKPDIGSFEK